MDCVFKTMGWATRWTTVVAAAALVGCGNVGGTGGGTTSTGGGDATTDDSTIQNRTTITYNSVGGTAGLTLSADEDGGLVLESFDPGAFVLAMTSSGVDPAQSDGSVEDLVIVDDGDNPSDAGGGTGDDATTGGSSSGTGEDTSSGTSTPFINFPPGFEFTDAFNDFAGQLLDGSLDFNSFPFDEFFESYELADLISELPELPNSLIGQFDFGQLPDGVEGYPDFPTFPNSNDNDFAIWFSDEVNGAPSDVPEKLFEYVDALDQLLASVGGEGTGPVLYDDVKDLLPEGALTLDQVIQRLDDFGQNSPLIGQDMSVNADLEVAFQDHPPVPDGFEAIAFQGDVDQFDDLFTIYSQPAVGQTRQVQVNSTFSTTLVSGVDVTGSQTTILESIVSEATPLIEMAARVYQAQWTVNIRQLTNVDYAVENQFSPGTSDMGSLHIESLSQMGWTVVFKETDTDADGAADQILVTGEGTFELLDVSVEGSEALETLSDSLVGPSLVQPLRFEVVMDID